MDPKATERQPSPALLDHCRWFDLEPQLVGNEFLTGLVHLTKSRASLPPGNDVVHVANHSFDLQSLQQEAVEWSEVEIGKMLRGERADREPFPGSALMGSNDSITKLESPSPLDAAADLSSKHLLIDRGKIGTHIHLEKPIMATTMLLRSKHCSPASLARSASEGVSNKVAVEDRTEVCHQGMVQHPFSKAGSMNQPGLRISNPESSHSPDFHRSVQNLGL